MESKKKNGYIELLRFLFCLMIFLHHSEFVGYDTTENPLPQGYLAVEFFFLVSGYFAMRSVEKRFARESAGAKTNPLDDLQPMAYSMKMTLRKLSRIFPYAAVGTILAYLWKWLYTTETVSLREGFWGFWNLPLELLFLPMSGVMDTNIGSYLNAPLWYLSAMLLVLPVVVYVAVRFRDVFRNYLVWAFPLILSGILLNKADGPVSWGLFLGVTYTGVIRAIIDLMLGCLVYLGSEKIRIYVQDHEKYQSGLYKVLLFVGELGCLLFFLVLCSNKAGSYVDEAGILAMAVSLMISFSGCSITGSMQGKFWEFLGGLSLPIYCLHWPLYQIVAACTDGMDYYLRVGIVFLVCLVGAVLLNLTVKKLGKRSS